MAGPAAVTDSVLAELDVGPGDPLRRSPFLFGLTATLGGLLAVAIGQAIVSLAQVLVLILVSAFLAVGLNPAVGWLVDHGIRRGGAIALVFIVVILAFVGVLLAIVPPLVDQVTQLIASLPDLIEELRSNDLVQRLDEQFGIVDQIKGAATGTSFTSAFGGILGVGVAVVGALFSGFTILVLTLYFLGSMTTITDTAYKMVPATRRPRVRHLGDQIIASVGGFVAGQAAVATLAGLSSFAFLEILSHTTDAPLLGSYALALALVVALFDLIPLIGATVAAAVVVIVGLVDSLTVGLICVGFYVAYQQLENYVISPRIMRRSVDVAPIVTVISALVGGTLLGVVGALVAIPMGAAVTLIVREVVIPRQQQH